MEHFPRYNAMFLYREDLDQRAPKFVVALRRLEGMIDEAIMLDLNQRVDLQNHSEQRVAAEFLNDKFNSKINRDAIGSSINRKTAQGVSPNAVADSLSEEGTSVIPVIVLRTIGNRLYKNSAAIAGATPIVGNPIWENPAANKANSARPGMVCTISTVLTMKWPIVGRLAARIPNGTDIRIAEVSETITRSMGWLIAPYKLMTSM